MPDTSRTSSALKVLLADNGTGDISPQDLRDLLVSVAPPGIIVMWSGLLSAVPGGWQLCDGTSPTPDLRDKFIKGWAAGVDPGGTGGGSYTPAGTVSAPTFTGTALGTHSHAVGTLGNSSDSAGTPAGSVAAPTFTGSSATTSSDTAGTPAGTVAWPVGVPTHSGTAISDHGAHTHSVTSNVTVDNHASHTHTYTDVVNHVHVQSVNSGTTGGLSGYGVDTSTSTSATSGYSTANPTGGVATGKTAGPDATQTHNVTNNAVTSGNPSATLTHTVSSQGTVAWPVGAVPAFSGTSMSNHSHTVTAKGSNDAPAFTGTALGTHTHTITGSTDTASAGTPAGSISAPNFTGTAASPEPTYYKLAYIMRL